MKYAVQMGSDAMIYITSFMKFGSGIQKLIRGRGYTDRQTMLTSKAYIYFIFLIRKES
jgi:hypothetical protein